MKKENNQKKLQVLELFMEIKDKNLAETAADLGISTTAAFNYLNKYRKIPPRIYIQIARKLRLSSRRSWELYCADYDSHLDNFPLA